MSARSDREGSTAARLRVVSLAAPDRDRAAEVLASAFRDNPLNVAVIGTGERRRLRSNLHGTRSTLAGAERGEGLTLAAWTDDEALAGVLVAASPYGYPLSAPSLVTQLRCLVGQGWSIVRRWDLVYRQLDRLHPLGDHWYLDVLGVRPELQGRGVGGALMAAFLARVDLEASGSYLETDRPENVRFYERRGFEVKETARVLGVDVWCMWRAPTDPGLPGQVPGGVPDEDGADA